MIEVQLQPEKPDKAKIQMSAVMTLGEAEILLDCLKRGLEAQYHGTVNEFRWALQECCADLRQAWKHSAEESKVDGEGVIVE